MEFYVLRHVLNPTLTIADIHVSNSPEWWTWFDCCIGLHMDGISWETGLQVTDVQKRVVPVKTVSQLLFQPTTTDIKETNKQMHHHRNSNMISQKNETSIHFRVSQSNNIVL